MEFIPLTLAEELAVEMRMLDRQRNEEELRLAIALLGCLTMKNDCPQDEYELLTARLSSGDYLITLPHTLLSKWDRIEGARELLSSNRYIDFIDQRILGDKFLVHPRSTMAMYCDSTVTPPAPTGFNTELAS